MRLLRAFPVVLLATLAACDDGLPLGPNPILDDARQYASVKAEIAEAGCTLGEQISQSSSRSLLLARSDLPFRLPALHKVRKTGKKGVVYQVLHVAVNAGTGEPLILSCIVPKNDHGIADAIATAAQRTPPSEWRAAVQRLVAAPASDLPVAALAGNLLRKEILPNARRLDGPPQIGATQSRTAFYGDTIQKLAVISVTATPDYSLINYIWLRSMWDTVDEGRHFSTELWANYNLYSPECDAYQLDYWNWVSSREQAEEAYESMAPTLNAIATALGVGAAELQSKVCEPRPGGLDLCLDWFIARCNVLGFPGDCRGFDPNAKFWQSRVQMYINPATLDFEVKWGHTKVTVPMGGCTVTPCSYHTYSVDDSVDVYKPPVFTQIHADGSFNLKFDWDNNLCIEHIAGTEIKISEPCPSINGNLNFWKDPTKPGGFRIEGVHDMSPSLGVYRHNGSSFTPMLEKPELAQTGVQFMLGLLMEMYISTRLNPPIPPAGCYLY